LLVQRITFGVHLPIMGLGRQEISRNKILSYARKAEDLGIDYVSVNDHIVYRTDWLDSLTTLASIAAATTKICLGTSILNIVARNPIVSAKALSSIDVLSSGRVFAGVGPGSHRADYDVCGIPFEQRWERFGESLEILSLLWSQKEPIDYSGTFYKLDKVAVRPAPLQKPRPPILIGSWGSETVLKKVAKYGDGWMASAYNITPESFKERWKLLLAYRRALGKDVESFQNSLVTMFGYISSDEEKAKRALRDILSPALGRNPEELEATLLFGTVGQCVLKLRNFFDAGVQRVHFWPVMDHEDQLEIFAKEVIPEF
jgi:alkanesulfonate monooxygenase SsuD/methylene tetrahydromethanopterin reductase-like flavin-dependent oxidoreductase (luciferase family)